MARKQRRNQLLTDSFKLTLLKSEEPKPQSTRFTVISPNDKIKARASASPDAHKKAQPLENKGLSQLSQLILKKYLITR